jgi:hypothetical protein
LRSAVAAALLVLGLVALPGGAGAAGGAAPETAAALQGEQSGSLPGAPGGNFAWFRISYPGSWPVHLELIPDTGNTDILRYVGFKVYGPQPGHVYAEGKLEGSAWRGDAELFSPEPGDYLIQVFNYYPNPNWAVGFTLRAANVPPQPGQGEPTPGPAPGSAGYVAIPIEGVQTGQLEPGSGGRFRYYSFYLPRDRSATVNLQVRPDDAGVLGVVGFKVYGPERGREYLQSEAEPHRTPNQRGTLWVDRDGLYVVQVYNYHPVLTIDYSLWVTNPS